MMLNGPHGGGGHGGGGHHGGGGGFRRGSGWGGWGYGGWGPGGVIPYDSSIYDGLTIVQAGAKFNVMRVGSVVPVATFGTLAEAQAYIARTMGLFGALGSLSGTITTSILIVGGVLAAGALYLALKRK